MSLVPRDFYQKSGIYIVSYMKPEPNKTLLFKIGLAISKPYQGESGRTAGLSSRLDQYLLYWPLGVHIFGIFTTRYDRTNALEKIFHNYVKTKGKVLEPQLHTHESEWAIMSLQDCYIMMNVISERYQTAYCSAYIFNPSKMILATTPQEEKKVAVGTPPRNPYLLPAALPATLPQLTPQSRVAQSASLRASVRGSNGEPTTKKRRLIL